MNNMIRGKTKVTWQEVVKHNMRKRNLFIEDINDQKNCGGIAADN